MLVRTTKKKRSTVSLRPWHIEDAFERPALINSKRVQASLCDGLPYTAGGARSFLHAIPSAASHSVYAFAVLAGRQISMPVPQR